MSIASLPVELWTHVAAALATCDDRSLWRVKEDVVRDYCAIAASSKALQPLQRCLREHVVTLVGSDRSRPRSQLFADVLEEQLDDADIEGPETTAQDLRRLAYSWGVKGTGSKADIRRALRAHVKAIQRAERLADVDLNPVHEKKRDQWRVGLLRICMSHGKAQYKLRDKDLEGFEFTTKRVRCGFYTNLAKMYRVVDLRRACMARYGSIENHRLGEQGRQRMRRELAFATANVEGGLEKSDAEAWAYTREHYTGTMSTAAIAKFFDAACAVMALPQGDREILSKYGPKKPPAASRLKSVVKRLRERYDQCAHLIPWDSSGVIEEYIRSAKEADFIGSVLERYEELRDAAHELNASLPAHSMACSDFVIHGAGHPYEIAQTLPEMVKK